jgi:hypothetical protein
MTRLLSEVQAMHNPALGAALIWRFACGYAPQNEAHEACRCRSRSLSCPWFCMNERAKKCPQHAYRLGRESSRRSSGIGGMCSLHSTKERLKCEAYRCIRSVRRWLRDWSR